MLGDSLAEADCKTLAEWNLPGWVMVKGTAPSAADSESLADSLAEADSEADVDSDADSLAETDSLAEVDSEGD